jgi:hypothetical protein
VGLVGIRQSAGHRVSVRRYREPRTLLSSIDYIYRDGDEHLLTDMGHGALAQPGVYPEVAQ